MSPRITRLRIAGFKSFADPATIDILPGLTGIVGPNGCGKSNVVEALRWAMGESSARALRGGELDDLIFAGTRARAARSIAEVTLWLENAIGVAPAPFSTADTLEICRRAERGSGSDFRLNGRALRARDVTTLFADLSSGARSSSIVSQNRVSALIAAKPEERRALLEEAAGITGLHARRHDAELKLRQAEGNIERSEDLRQQLATRLDSLEGQTRQARRYRELSETIRKDEHRLAWLGQKKADEQVERCSARLEAAKAEAANAAHAAIQAAQELAARSEAIGSVRQTVETLREGRDELRLVSGTTRAALARAEEAIGEIERRLQAASEDRDIAQLRLAESAARLSQLDAERERCRDGLAALPDRLAALAGQRARHESDLAGAGNRRETLARALDEAQQRAHRLRTEHDAAERLVAALDEEHRTLGLELNRLSESLPLTADLEAQETVLATRQTERAALVETCERLDDAHQEARLALARAEQEAGQTEETARKAREEIAELEAQIAALDAQISAQEETLRSLAASRLSRDALAALDDRAEKLDEAVAGARAERDALRHRADRAEQAVLAAESERQTALRTRTLLDQDHMQATQALTRQTGLIAQLEKERDDARASLPAEERLAAASGAHGKERNALERLDAGIASLTEERASLRSDLDGHEAALREARASHLTLAARHEALEASLPAEQLPAPLIEALIVPPGLEKAIASVLGETLTASLLEEQSRCWAVLPAGDSPSLPDGVPSLASLMSCPPALARCLAATGLVNDRETGASIQQRLAPGQCLVSRDGALWRWDGFRDTGTEATAASAQMALRATLREVAEARDEAACAIPPLEAGCARMKARDHDLSTRLTELNALHREADRRCRSAREEEQALREKKADGESRLARTIERLDEAAIQRDEALARASQAESARAALPAAAVLDSSVAETRAVRDRSRSDLADAETRLNTLEQDSAEARETAGRKRLEDETTALREATLVQARLRAVEERTRASQRCAAIAIDGIDSRAEAARAERESGRLRLSALDEERETRKRALLALEETIGTARAQLDAQRTSFLALSSRISALQPRHGQLTQALETARENRAALAPVPDLSGDEASLLEAEAQETTLRATRDALAAEEQAASALLDQLERDIGQLELRIGETQELHATRETDLTRATERIDGVNRERETTRADARQQAEALARHETRLAEAETGYAQAGARLLDIETAMEALEAVREREERRSTQMREELILLQERHAQALAQRDAIENRVEAPSDDAQDAMSGDPVDGNETALRRRLSRCQKEREALGPVNLLAEQEYEEARTRSEHLAREHEELEAAIGRLRGSINLLKKEGRERLQAVFVEVDHHFQSLFSRMFNGGRAHLGLVGSDDPLEAGLEIFAQPPGKKLSTLSLLSGGEQALTALSLIFATFRCQPAPLCILDEVDAPLDDANVERLCGLLRDMTTEAETRFLIVTHHQLTMAHMDRLFGVTMQERGVSQVLSVDLSAAAGFIETAPR
ncbi:AAA family ATPase [Swaminathania salitolerans]|uniref:Chromosome partition protein Smc n=1 Tax=Swaminathania salitolerans TaxID=182838 RepID=A0A511BMT9_9PROT|nr:AAA family ATPase [Swaminathania salitolerans]GBQ16241.1 chromosome segregation protein SMC [Swaminathania salitolerans LMG 21291]GEL01646.1 chromosome partition protein Smc [Swaminathania salitolerans]